MSDPGLAAEIGGRFDHVLVDEYQDTNRLQASILLALKPDGCGLTVVGDDAQAIYSFRAATVRNILDFPGQFSPPAEVITLDRNYRSTQPILDAANAVIELASERFTKNLWTDRRAGEPPRLVAVRDEADQARYIVERVLENRETGMLLKQQSILFRASHHSGPLEVELTRRNIPFVKFGGLKFLEAAHVKDLLAVLRFVENPRDRVSGFRLLQLMPGVGPGSAQRVLDYTVGAADPRGALADAPPPPRAGDHWKSFLAMVADLNAGRAGWPAELERARLWYEPHLDRIHDDAVVRRADLIQLEQIAAGYRSREHFLTELTLDPPEATSDQAGVPLLDEDYLILSTIHSAKGPGMAVGLCAERCRRLHPLRSRHRNRCRNRVSSAGSWLLLQYRAPRLWPPAGPPLRCRPPLSSERQRSDTAPCPVRREALLCAHGNCRPPGPGKSGRPHGGQRMSRARSRTRRPSRRC
jgi:DNA helicase-2/ATP-dependent DNA helicase PcrA